MAITRSPQRRKVNRKAGDRRVVRVETKDYLGNPRYITADLLDSSDIGLGVSLRTPLEAGASIVIRTNLDPKRSQCPAPRAGELVRGKAGRHFPGRPRVRIISQLKHVDGLGGPPR